MAYERLLGDHGRRPQTLEIDQSDREEASLTSQLAPMLLQRRSVLSSYSFCFESLMYLSSSYLLTEE